MDKFYDLTDFDVVRSDNSESYVVLEKYFDSGDEALSFITKMQNEILEAIKSGDMTFFGTDNYYPYVCGYLPLVNFKLPNCVGYDEDGNYEEEGGMDFEMSCCIVDTKTYHDGRVEMTLLFVVLPEEIEDSEDIKTKSIKTFKYGSF